ncbi:hypothetical protein EB796_011074 [Bugula neritina]|nr:hypothetical protein EB796_011074 [Bugula neritina]
MACSHGSLSFEVALEKTAFCCGENVPMRLEITNGVSLKVWPFIQLIQRVDYCVDKTGFGIRRDATHTVWEYKGPPVPKHSTLKLENLSQALQIPVMPPTTSTCEIIRIEYKLKVSLLTIKWGEPLHLTIPILVTPYYQQDENIRTLLKPAEQSVIGGNYTSPELQTGAVYDGTEEARETTVYQPVYVCVPHKRIMQPTTSTLSASDVKHNISDTKVSFGEGVADATPKQVKVRNKKAPQENKSIINTEIEISDCRVSSL